MKTYNITNRLSAQAKKEVERIISTHDKYKKSYFFSPASSAKQRRSNEKKFKCLNPDVSFIQGGSLITVSMSYKESCHNVYYSISITKDDYFKDESSSNPVLKNIRLVKSLLN